MFAQFFLTSSQTHSFSVLKTSAKNSREGLADTFFTETVLKKNPKLGIKMMWACNTTVFYLTHCEGWCWGGGGEGGVLEGNHPKRKTQNINGKNAERQKHKKETKYSRNTKK